MIVGVIAGDGEHAARATAVSVGLDVAETRELPLLDVEPLLVDLQVLRVPLLLPQVEVGAEPRERYADHEGEDSQDNPERLERSDRVGLLLVRDDPARKLRLRMRSVYSHDSRGVQSSLR